MATSSFLPMLSRSTGSMLVSAEDSGHTANYA
jgi:hypothetical protein